MRTLENNVHELIERAVCETNQLLRHPPEPVRPEHIHIVETLPPGMKRRDPIRWREDGNVFIHETLVHQVINSHREKGGTDKDVEKAVINLLKSVIARFYYIVRLGYNEWNHQKIGSVANVSELTQLRDALNDLAESINLTFHDHHLTIIDQTLKKNLYVITSNNLAIIAAKYGTDIARQLLKHVPRLLEMTLPYTWPTKEEMLAFIKNKNVPYIVRSRKILSLQRLLELSKNMIFSEPPQDFELVDGYRFIYTPEGLTSEGTKVFPPSTKVRDNIYEIQKRKASPEIKKLRLTISQFNTLIDANFAGLELMFTNSETLTSRITEAIIEHLEKMVDLYTVILPEGERSDGELVSRAFKSMKSDLQEELSFYTPHIPLPEDIRARITGLGPFENLSEVKTVHEMFNYVHIRSFSALDSAATHLGKDYFFLIKDNLKVIDASISPWIDTHGIVVSPVMRSVLSWAEEETEGRIMLVDNSMWAHIRMGDHSAVVHVHPFPPDEGGSLAIAYAEGAGLYLKGRAFRVTLVKHILESLNMRVTIKGDNEFIQATLDKDSGIKTSRDILSAFHVSMSALNSTRNIDITVNDLPINMDQQVKIAHEWARIFLAENDFPFKIPNEFASLFVDSDYTPGYVSEEPSYIKYLEYKERREKQWPFIKKTINNELKRLNLPIIGDKHAIVGQEIIDTYFNDPIILGFERNEFIMINHRAERKSDYMSRRHIFQLLSLEPVSILFVCTGNTCRSHMAEHIMKHFFKLSGEDNVHVWSRGTLVQKIRIRTAVYKSLSELGISAPEQRHIPKQIADHDIRDADIIFAMAEGHREYVLECDPNAGPKIYLLTEFSSPDEESYSIVDPSGQSDEVYASTAKELREHIEKIVKRFRKMDVESLQIGVMLRQLEGHIQFETMGGMGRYLVERADLTVDDYMLDIYALRDSDTDNVRYGRVYIVQDIEGTYHRTRLDPFRLSQILEKSYFTVGVFLEITEAQRKIARNKLYTEPQDSIGGVQVKGLGASRGKGKLVSGFVTYKRGHVQKEQKVFITPFTTPDDVDVIKESCAVVTTGGGILSHAGITTREFGIPSVILYRAQWIDKDRGKHIVLIHSTPENYSKTPSGIWMSSKVITGEIHLKEGDLITVDGLTGTVVTYESEIQPEIQKAFLLLNKSIHSPDAKKAHSELLSLIKKTRHFEVVYFIVNHLLADNSEERKSELSAFFKSISSNTFVADDWLDYQKQFVKLQAQQAWTVINTFTESVSSAFSVPLVKILAQTTRQKIISLQQSHHTFTQPLESFPDINRVDELEKERTEQLKKKSHREINNLLDRKNELTPDDIPEIRHVLISGNDNGLSSDSLDKILKDLEQIKSKQIEEDLKSGHLISLEQLTEDSTFLAGGKSVREGIILNAHPLLLRSLSPYLKESGFDFAIPRGFVITTHTLREFFHKKGIVEKLDNISAADMPAGEKSQAIQQLIRNNMITAEDELGQSILRAFKKYTSDAKKAWVAVRSSSVLEDTYGAAFAGMGITELFVDEASLLDKICDVKASAWTERAIVYSEERKINLREIRQAVLVQEMIESEVSGVIFTQEPVTYNSSQVVINASYGLGEAVVSGLVLPDQYITDKVRGEEVSELFIGTKRVKIIRNPKGSGTKTDYVSHKERQTRCLSLNQTKILTHIARLIEEFFLFPVDIEFAIQGSTIWIVQVRPVTTGMKV